MLKKEETGTALCKGREVLRSLDNVTFYVIFSKIKVNICICICLFCAFWMLNNKNIFKKLRQGLKDERQDKLFSWSEGRSQLN